MALCLLKKAKLHKNPYFCMLTIKYVYVHIYKHVTADAEEVGLHNPQNYI